jgi:ABC-type amino acid transport substrate-binding protein
MKKSHLAVLVALADRLDDIQKAGVLRVAAFDSNPPFGYVDARSKQIVGLDVDYAKELEIVPTNPANRIPLLTSNKVDLVLANFTITEERAKQVNFSIPYFASSQQFIVKKGALKSADELGKLRIGVDKGTTNEIVLRDKYPSATLVPYDDTPFAFTALRNGNVQAITQDGPKLIGLLAIQNLFAFEVAAIGKNSQFFLSRRTARLLSHRGQLGSVMADVGDLVGDDQMVLGLHRGLDVVSDDAGASATGGH